MRTKLTSRFSLLFMTFAMLLALPAMAFADDLDNNLSDQVNPGFETTSVEAGQSKNVQIRIVPANGDGQSGCNFDPNTNQELKVNVTSANTNVATVSPSILTFTGCDDTSTPTVENAQTVAVKGETVGGPVEITFSERSNTTGNTFDFRTARFSASVTADVTAPTVTSVAPTGQSEPVGTNLEATFSEAMNATTISGSTFTLKNGTQTVAANVSYDSATKTATLNPTADLAYSTNYNATVTTGAKDAAGNALAANRTWSFTTAAPPDSTAPTSSASATVPNGSGTSPYTAGDWTNKDVTVTLNASDNQGGSGVKEIRYTTNGSEPTASSTLYSAPFTVSSTTTVKFRAYDNVGNAEAVKTFQVNIDKIAPAPNCGSASSSWLGTDASIACSPTDGGGSGLASSVPATFNLSTSVAAGTENANASTDSRTISDAAGNTATAGPIGGNMIDKKAPEVLPADVTNTTWRNSSLSQNFTSSDGGSGLASGQNLGANGSFTLTAALESTNATTPTEVSKDIKDAVGNTTTRKVSALIDLTKPTIDASVSNNPAPSGWYNISTGGPVVHFECGDLLSGIAAGACPADYTITTDGLNQGYSDSVSDRAGNTNSDGVSGLKVDLTAPDLAGAPDLLATSDSGDTSDNLTNDKTPTFDITAEAGSTVRLYAEKNGTETLLGSATATNGVATITSNQQLSDGEYRVYAKVTDQAGNVSSTNGINVTIATIDATAPGAPGLDMAASSDTGVSDSDDKTNNAKPTFGGTAEAGSTVKLYDGTSLLTSIQVGAGGSWSFTPASALGEGTHQIKATATDAADNTSSESQLSVVIDLTNPVVTLGQASGTVGLSGWYKSVVTQTFNASDTGGTGIVGPTSLPVSSGAAEEGSNVMLASGSVSDVAGNTNPGVSAGPFKIDLSDPTNILFVDGPAAGSSHDFGSVPAAPTCTADDAVSGPPVCAVTGYSTAVGTHTMTATATDNAGRKATATRTYTVVGHRFGDFYQPVDKRMLNGVKGGSTVPMKFEMFQGFSGTEIKSTAAIKTWSTQKVNCTSFESLGEDAIEQYTTGATSLRWDTTGDFFILNWQAPKAAVGTCYQVTIVPNDGSTNTLTALFRIR